MTTSSPQISVDLQSARRRRRCGDTLATADAGALGRRGARRAVAAVATVVADLVVRRVVVGDAVAADLGRLAVIAAVVAAAGLAELVADLGAVGVLVALLAVAALRAVVTDLVERRVVVDVAVTAATVRLAVEAALAGVAGLALGVEAENAGALLRGGALEAVRALLAAVAGLEVEAFALGLGHAIAAGGILAEPRAAAEVAIRAEAVADAGAGRGARARRAVRAEQALVALLAVLGVRIAVAAGRDRTVGVAVGGVARLLDGRVAAVALLVVRLVLVAVAALRERAVEVALVRVDAARVALLGREPVTVRVVVDDPVAAGLERVAGRRAAVTAHGVAVVADLGAVLEPVATARQRAVPVAVVVVEEVAVVADLALVLVLDAVAARRRDRVDALLQIGDAHPARGTDRAVGAAAHALGLHAGRGGERRNEGDDAQSSQAAGRTKDQWQTKHVLVLVARSAARGSVFGRGDVRSRCSRTRPRHQDRCREGWSPARWYLRRRLASRG